MEFTDLRSEILDRFKKSATRVLWTILIPGGAAELTGAEIAERAQALASRYCSVPERSVVLLLLPHCEELFLLHIGLILLNRVPAILAWPTSRVDADKYQHNLLHQLRNLPASQVITLPRLAESMAPSLPYSTTAVR